MKLGILCGLESEAVIARKIPNALVACAGARPGQARALAEELVQKGATHLASFGIAGALDPALPLGALVIGTHVRSVAGNWVCDREWGDKLVKAIPGARLGGIWGSETLIDTAVEKTRLFRETECASVDMESQCLAEIAAKYQKPMTVIRTVCDSATMDVPPVVMDMIAPDGSIAVGKAIKSVLLGPQKIPGLIHVGWGIYKALSALKKSLKALEVDPLSLWQ